MKRRENIVLMNCWSQEVLLLIDHKKLGETCWQSKLSETPKQDYVMNFADSKIDKRDIF